jgi:hypothetical protein
MSQNNTTLGSQGCEHCWHALRGPYHMVVPDGCFIQQCCKCVARRVVHSDHAIRQVQAIAEGADHV